MDASYKINYCRRTIAFVLPISSKFAKMHILSRKLFSYGQSVSQLIPFYLLYYWKSLSFFKQNREAKKLGGGEGQVFLPTNVSAFLFKKKIEKLKIGGGGETIMLVFISFRDKTYRVKMYSEQFIVAKS
jgi:hypothetical protein